jgi:ubiquitin carboxyl-terminal hydrolase L3
MPTYYVAANVDAPPGRGTDLSNLINDAIPLAPVERANLLYNSEALEHAHQGAAVEGQSSAPAAEDHVDLHYVAFVKDTKTNHLWELDGRRTGPLDRGELGPDDDVLSERALDLSVRPFMKRESGEEMRFSIVALAPSLD